MEALCQKIEITKHKENYEWRFLCLSRIQQLASNRYILISRGRTVSQF